MNVSLTPELEALVQEKVATGRYASASEVVREALRLLEQRDRAATEETAWLRKAWQEGLDSGPPAPVDFDELKREARRRIAGRRKSA